LNPESSAKLEEDTPDFLQPKLRLFLSVDIVNSTAFKQASLKDRKADDSEGNTPLHPVEPWFSPINRFYREIESSFSKHWEHLSKSMEKRYQWPTGPKPELWNAAGDELLYVKTLDDHRQALVTISAWIKAMNEHRTDLRARYPMLDLKAAAWLAGFPVRDAVITKVPFIITSFCADGVTVYEANHLGAQWRFYGAGGVNWASD
jgi:hypothetical protein